MSAVGGVYQWMGLSREVIKLRPGRKKDLFSYDICLLLLILFIISVQKLLIDMLFNKEAAHAWIYFWLYSNVLLNVLLAPT